MASNAIVELFNSIVSSKTLSFSALIVFLFLVLVYTFGGSWPIYRVVDENIFYIAIGFVFFSAQFFFLVHRSLSRNLRSLFFKTRAFLICKKMNDADRTLIMMLASNGWHPTNLNIDLERYPGGSKLEVLARLSRLREWGYVDWGFDETVVWLTASGRREAIRIAASLGNLGPKD